MSTWTEEQDDYLRQSYPRSTAREIGDALGRSMHAVRGRIKTLGLQQTRAPFQDPEGPWTCTVCEETKEKTEFYIAAKGKQSYRCKACLKKDRKRRWAEDVNGSRTKQMEIWRNDPLRYEKMRAARLLRDFGLATADYEAMLASQGGVCAICKQPETKIGKSGEVISLAVDHDHACCPTTPTCGRCVRKLLCARCNQVLGHLEQAGIAEAVAAYIEEHTHV